MDEKIKNENFNDDCQMRKDKFKGYTNNFIIENYSSQDKICLTNQNITNNNHNSFNINSNSNLNSNSNINKSFSYRNKNKSKEIPLGDYTKDQNSFFDIPENPNCSIISDLKSEYELENIELNKTENNLDKDLFIKNLCQKVNRYQEKNNELNKSNIEYIKEVERLRRINDEKDTLIDYFKKYIENLSNNRGDNMKSINGIKSKKGHYNFLLLENEIQTNQIKALNIEIYNLQKKLNIANNKNVELRRLFNEKNNSNDNDNNNDNYNNYDVK